MKITIEQLRQAISIYPDDAWVYAYEGEKTGIVIRSADDKEQIGFIEARDE